MTWRPPRRNGHQIRIGTEECSLQEWSRRCGISHNNLCNVRRRHSYAAMVARIRLGLRGQYRPTSGGALHKSKRQ
jgi:hypothetical protein